MDSGEFIERHRKCGGEIVEIEIRRIRSSLSPSPNGSKTTIKQCSRCGQSPKKRDIVSVRPGEILGWKKA